MGMVGVGVAPVMISRVNRPVIIPLLGASLGLESMWVSIVFGVSAVIEILLVISAGTLMDRYGRVAVAVPCALVRSEEHTSELQSRGHLVCRLLLEPKHRTLL